MMATCKENLHCRNISDPNHRKKFFHHCIYGSTCQIKEKNHTDQFLHHENNNRKKCPSSFACWQIDKIDHQIDFIHDCHNGEICDNVNPDHFFLFNHLKEILPACNCDSNDFLHTKKYSHVCKILDCNQVDDLNHTKYWLHQMPFCPSRLTCFMNDVSQYHRTHYRHICLMGLECLNMDSSLHTLRFSHIDLKNKLPKCPNLDQCSNNDLQHKWEYSHLCRSFNCGTSIEHGLLFYHNNSGFSISSFDDFWFQTGIKNMLVTKTLILQSVPHISHENKLISDKFLKTIGDSSIQIQSIERVVNPALASLYSFEQKKVALNNNDELNEQLLFHGSRNWKNILENGFDYRFSNDGCRFGRGNYFAFNASYSHSGYVGQDDNGNTVILVAHVLVGKSVQVEPNSSLTVAPNGADSVVEPNVMCIVYNDNRAYPSYLVRYK